MYLLPLFCLVLLIIIVRIRTRRHTLPWREDALRAAVIWGIRFVAITEILSLFQALSFFPLVIFWSLIGILSLLYLAEKRNVIPKRLSFSSPQPPLTIPEWTCLGGTVFILVAVGLTALLAPPNNWDAMTYHMPRVMHWIQNRTVANYPTNCLRQLTYPPFAEYAIMHFQILSHGDRFANMIQWLAFLGSVVAASLVAKELGGRRQTQFFSALLTATIPLAILQASGPKNDLVLAFWSITTLFFILRYQASARIQDLAFAASGFGLALLTKGTAFFILPPFLLLLFLGPAAQRLIFLRRHFLVLICIPLLINFPFQFRHFLLLRGTLEPTQKAVLMGAPSLTGFTSNLIRNIGSELGTPFPGANRIIEQGILNVHSWLGIDAKNSQATFGDYLFHFPDHPFHEDHASSVFHTFFIMVCFLVFLWKRPGKNEKRVLHPLIAFCLSIILFCLTIRWQPWICRFHLPFLIIACPITAVIAQRFSPKATGLLTGLFLFMSLFWAFLNQSRPLVGPDNIFHTPRSKQYFANLTGYFPSYKLIAETIKNNSCRDIGLVFGEDSWEYPLWAILKEQNIPLPRIGHVRLRNPSAATPDPLGNFNPCTLITDAAEPQRKIMLKNQSFVLTRWTPFLQLLEPDPDGNLERTMTISRFNRTLELGLVIFQMIREIGTAKTVSPQIMLAINNLYPRFLQENSLLDVKDLNRLYPDLGINFQGQFITGINDVLNGLSAKDPELIANGEHLMQTWFIWFNQHTAELQKILTE